MRALLETLAQTEDRVLAALVVVIGAYLVWGAWLGVRRQGAGDPATDPAGSARDRPPSA